ncbi:MAG: hypothetical protein AB2806_21445, partial [Candidatus Thiodiazotropha sp.]
AIDNGVGGLLMPPAAYYCKHPPEQYPDDEAYSMVQRFIKGEFNEISHTDDIEKKAVREL